jgi:predicted nucleic acid-binding protein
MALAASLVDTSVWARLHLPAVASSVVPEIDRGLVATCSVIDMEIQYSARSAAELQELLDERAGFERLDVDQVDWDIATETRRLLAEAGMLRAVGIPDLLIAAVAARHGVEVVHYDRDFDHVAAVTGQSVRWAVPPGSVD